MSEYVIFTDSGCDMTPEDLTAEGIKCVSLIFKLDGDDREYRSSDMPAKEFYDKMRDGAAPTTSAVNMEEFKDAFRPVLADGKDILYIGFSSGLSTTYNSACMAAEELKDEFPDRRVLTVDSLAASAGQGLLVMMTNDKKKTGATLDEAAAYAENTRLKVCHWFSVDDLKYLKRGGRVSPTVALVGAILGIKPVMHVDNDGHLINITKVRGRNAALAALAEKIGELAGGKPESPIYICHGDCEDDVETLKGIIKDNYGLSVEKVVYTGTVIGAHSGPGTIAVFFLGSER